MNIMIFDTETTSLEKPFCYNIGYVIKSPDNETLVSRNYVVEQVWHNPMLFTTAYYSDKRPIYVNEMRAKKALLNKFGYICQQMIRDINNYNVVGAYAFNSTFDEKVFNFNCEWFKCNNPFDNIPIFDIRGYAHTFLVNSDFLDFCDTNNFYTESGNYSTTAETFFAYITNNKDYKEEHTALQDSIIESDILFKCLSAGAILNTEYKTKKSIERKQLKVFTIIDTENNKTNYNCYGYTFYKTKNTIKLK